MIKYSIIIPIYNMEKYLQECIDSVVNQLREDVEIILINDGSTDKSLEICESNAKKYSNIILINKKNSGTTDTILMGIKKAHGKYTCFLDSDDKIVDNYFNILDSYIDGECDMILYNYRKFYKDNYIDMEINKMPYGILEEKLVEELHKDFFSDFKRCSFYRWDKLIKTEILKNNIDKLSVRTTYLEDHAISFLNILESYRIIHIKEVLYNYRMRKNSVSRSINEKIFIDWKKMYNEMLKISKNYGYTTSKIYPLKLYFLYQYARYSMKSEKKHYEEKITIKDIKKIHGKDKKLVLILYKLRLKYVYKIILNLKLKKEKIKNSQYFD